jgi:glycosyltransferase involved in cell wall biosynthesis
MPPPSVLVLHNRYRVEGGEERFVRLQVEALARAGIEHATLERRSDESGRARAAVALLRGGADPGEVADHVQRTGARVVHAHNWLPLIGPRGLAAAREAGAAVVLHLHNVRLFCAIGVASRDGGPCFRCRRRRTLPGLVLNCRGSLPEAATYAAALSLHQPGVFAAVDRFVAPSGYAVRRLATLGVPADRLGALAPYLPAGAFARRSAAHEGRYALLAARLSEEKGGDLAIEAAAAAGVPLRVAGEGPQGDAWRALARRLAAPVEFLGRLPQAEVAELMAEAAMVVVPSRSHEFAPYAALEAMASGVPVVAARLGGLPELVGEASCVRPRDAAALAARMGALWADPEARRAEGEALLARASERHSEERFVRALVDLYERAVA